MIYPLIRNFGKHLKIIYVVLSLIFLKFARDKFEARRQELIDEGKENHLEMVDFYTAQIFVCVWFLGRDKQAQSLASKEYGFRNRQGDTLFIDARNIGVMIDRTYKELSSDDIERLVELTTHGVEWSCFNQHRHAFDALSMYPLASRAQTGAKLRKFTEKDD